MNNPETLKSLVTRHRTKTNKHNTTQKAKPMSNTDPTKNS